jgi:hypothetical protein
MSKDPFLKKEKKKGFGQGITYWHQPNLFGHASNNQDLTENSTIPFYISSYLLLEQTFMC